jgi:uncharacterized Zn-binding protein involved in type VI secretion
MPGFLLHNGAVMTCPHGGKVSVVPASPPRVLVNGLPVQTAVDQLVVTCTVPICVMVLWTNVSTRVMASGQPVALQTAPAGKGDGACVPPPPPVVVPPLLLAMQTRVVAT